MIDLSFTNLVFATGLIAGVTLDLLLLRTLLAPPFRIWPTPEPGSYEVRVWAVRGNTRAGEFYARRGFARAEGGRPVEGLAGPDGSDVPEVCFLRRLGES